MLKLVLTLLFFSIFPYLCFAEDELSSGEFKAPPLSILIQLDNNQYTVVSDSEQYMKGIDEQVLDSILSIEETRSFLKEHTSRQEGYRYIQLFYQWYFTKLPVLILQGKGLFEESDTIIKPVEGKDFSKVGFLFNPNKPVTAKRLIDFANYYEYDYFEKFNLFLFALYRNISEEELLILLERWNIKSNIGVYVRDYKDYIDLFLERFGKDKEKVRSALNQLTLPVTSVLHELVEANRALLFHRMLEYPLINVNIRNYLSQTVSHTIFIKEWKIGQTYIPALSKHPKVSFNIPDFQGWTLIFYAVAKSDDISFPEVEYLFEQKDRLNLELLDDNRRTLTLLAAELNKPNLSRFLHENGVPLPKKVSLFNSYITEDFRAVWFRYNLSLDLDRLTHLFDARSETPSFADFKQMDVNQIRPEAKETTWAHLKYYFLFQLLQDSLSAEESTRHKSISSLLFDETSNGENRDVKKIIRAVYRGDISAINKVFTDNPQTIEMLKIPLLGTQFYFEEYWSQRTIHEFNLLNRMNATIPSQLGQSLSFFSSMGSFLSEAIRANQPEVVQYLLSQGADPTINERGFVVRNSIMVAILIGELLYKHEQHYKDHMRIVDMLINHPSVTESFLNSEVMPGINYADLAALKGHLHALKQMYKKGVSISTKALWNTSVSIETFSFTSNLLLQTKFILEEQLKKDPNNKKLQRNLVVCERAFH